MKVSIVGASGLVGEELLKILEKRNFPIFSLHLFASKKSKGKKLLFRKNSFTIKEYDRQLLQMSDLAFFCTDSKVSKQYISDLDTNKTLCIDLSSAYRLEDDIPLVIPEINAEALKKHRGIIASPNCTTTLMLLPLFPLHKKYGIKRIIATTYQAASGGGKVLLDKLFSDAKKALNEKKPYPYGFNLFLHESSLHQSGYSEEEIKMREETKKILQDKNIQVSATCVRVPVIRTHSISLNVTFKNSFKLNDIFSLLEKTKGLKITKPNSNPSFFTPLDAHNKEEIFCSRLRLDSTEENTLECFVIGDQLLKGAALNAVQIAEKVRKL